MKKVIAIMLCVSMVVSLCGCRLLGDAFSNSSEALSDGYVLNDSVIIGDQDENGVNGTSDKGNADQKPQNTGGQGDNGQNDQPVNPNASTAPEVTVFAAVAQDIYIIGGKCSANTEYITVSGSDATTTKIVPDKGNSGGYFTGKVKISDSCNIDVQAKETGKDLSSKVSRYASINYGKSNLMTADDYKPYFGANSRMHFYSAILCYTLSNVADNSIKATARQNISSTVNAAKSVGAEVIYLVVPSSVAVYPETLPEYKAASGESLYKAFNSVASSCGAKVIYPLNTMNAHKNDGKGYKIYHNTDSHWSTYGAYFGVSELMNYIAGKYPAAKPRTVGEMGFYTAELFAGDSLFSFGDNSGFENYSTADANGGATLETGLKELTVLYNRKMPTDTLSQITRGKKSTYLTWDNSNERTVSNPNGGGLPSAVIVRDSFGRTAFDMVNDRFSKVTWLAEGDYTSVNSKISSGTNYVIYIVSERNLLKVMLNNKDISLTSQK
ncbi:MAG: hypothetical protein Q4B40_04890 [Clostridia bacterium]|nr:hypothetical protein [Clostridia bacterium]